MLIEDKDRNDNEVVRKLIAEAEKYSLAEHGNERLECYLLLSNMTSLWLLQTTGIPDDLYQKVDVFATTQEDFMAKSIFVKLPHINYQKFVYFFVLKYFDNFGLCFFVTI